MLIGAAVLAVAMAGSVSLVSAASADADIQVTATINVSGNFDGSGNRYIGAGDLGSGGQDEGQDPLFKLANGATLSNVVLGSPAADGIHCSGSCTLRNVTWQDVGEDAATFRGTNATVVVDGGSAAKASDKVFQDNRGAGGSVTIRNFRVNDFGKFYRSCGNCSTQAARTVNIQNLTATGGDVIAGVNVNYGDVARLSGLNIGSIDTCHLFNGNNSGDEPTKIGEGANGRNCIVS
ncbi:pectate lyase [Paractinoplanes rishiriensis]|uniref:Pectate lyase n=1 Tax=Paractinoplanes rishiriensis TaxID=1050105 RepID=A0A919KCG5_9ACTN|nr:pectate lyase [Actinoplanes rishiriensis]